jgi:hypothetical protein
MPGILGFFGSIGRARWYDTNMCSSGLAEEIEGLEPPADPHALTEALRLRDRLEAKIALGAAAFDTSGRWEVDHATSAVAWLKEHGVGAGDAVRLLSAGRRAAAVPALAGAWLDGRLSGGQVQAIVANVNDRTAELFASHAGDLVDALGPLSVTQTGNAMRAWRARAEALLDTDGPAEPERSLHASRTFGGRLEVRGSFDTNAAATIEAALRAAATDDDAATGTRTASARRAHALTDGCPV